ncbi:Acyl-CoA synthetase family member 2, mitochondrial [Nymphon striatum]|nr:Acyl-CoA synthetase family member 2, mitochondrial [Nymphon striatum]
MLGWIARSGACLVLRRGVAQCRWKKCTYFLRTLTSKVSYEHGTSIDPLVHLTFSDVLEEAVKKCPDDTAIISCHQGIERTFQQFQKDLSGNLLAESWDREQVSNIGILPTKLGRFDRLSAGLLMLGLKKGDRVAVVSLNCYEWIVTQFAVASAGLQLVTVNPAFIQSEIQMVLNKVISSYEEYLKMTYKDFDSFGKRQNWFLEIRQLTALEVYHHNNQKHKAGTIAYDDLIISGKDQNAIKLFESSKKYVQPDDCINIQFTSGTTGIPKAAMLSHHMLINNALFFGKAFGMTAKDVICLATSLFHSSGNVLGSIATMCYQSKLVLPAGKFDPMATLEAIQAKKCTAVYGTPTMYIDMLAQTNFLNYSFDTLRGGVMGASHCSEEVLQQLRKQMNMKDICVAYGTTENSPLIAITSIDQPLEKRVKTVGLSFKNELTASCDIFHTGETVKRRVVGELCCRGYQVMLGYLGEPEKTKEVLGDDRWYKTGDLASMDEEGYIKIVDRIKDVIIRGGENVYPREVEDFLRSHPKIVGAQVIGIPNKRFGEVVCSWIMLKPDTQLSEHEVREFCKENIAEYKIPEVICFVTEFPKNQTGKVEKNVMRQQMIQKLEVRDCQVQNLTETITEIGNPYRDDFKKLVALDTHNCADASVITTVNTIEEVGTLQ